MAESPKLRFLSLFVPDLDDASKRYEAIFGVPPSRLRHDAPARHPFSGTEPVVFELGGVVLALYQCDGRTTHAGDVGVGVVVDEPVAGAARRASQAGARVFYGPRAPNGDARKMVVFMTPDRHFFELFGADAAPADAASLLSK